MITYIKGDATAPQGNGPKIIAHVVNDVGAWGAGFVLALSTRWPQTRTHYRAWAMGRNGYENYPLELGKIMFSCVELDPTILVAHLCAQRGTGGECPLQYDALAVCLHELSKEIDRNEENGRASVHMPRIGCGLGGGTWDRVEPLIARWLDGVEVFVYDLP